MSYKAYGGVHNVLDGEADLADIKSDGCQAGQLMTIQHTLYTAIYSYDPNATAKELLCRMGQEDPDVTDFPMVAVATHGGPPGGDGIFVESAHMGDWGHLFIVPSDISDIGDYTNSPGRWVAVNYVLYLATLMDDGGGGGGSGETGHTMRRSIIPDTDATYDIGSAEYKIRHLFLSDSSLWIGDKNKISIDSTGSMKFKKRILGKVPKQLQTWIVQNLGSDYELIVKNTLSDAKKPDGSAWFKDSGGSIYTFPGSGAPIPLDVTIRQWLDIANILGMSVSDQNQLLDDLEDFEDGMDNSLITGLTSDFDTFRTATNASLAEKLGTTHGITLASLGGVDASELSAGLAGLDIGAAALSAVAAGGYEKGTTLRAAMTGEMDTKIGAQNFSTFATVAGLDSKLVEAKNYADSVDIISKVTAAGFETGALLRGDLQTQMDGKIGAQNFTSFASKTDLSDGLATKTLALLGGISADAAGVLADTKIGALDIAATAIAAVGLEGYAKTNEIAAASVIAVQSAGYAKTNEIDSIILGQGFTKAADLTSTLSSLMDDKVAAGTSGLVNLADVDAAISSGTSDFYKAVDVSAAISGIDLTTVAAFNSLKADVDSNDTLISSNTDNIASKVSSVNLSSLVAGAGYATTAAAQAYTDSRASTTLASAKTYADDETALAKSFATSAVADSASATANSYATKTALDAVEVKADAADTRSIAADAKADAATVEASSAKAKADIATEKAEKGLSDLDFAGLKR